MKIAPSQLFSKGDRGNKRNNFLQFPLIRIFLALIFILPAIISFNYLYKNIEPRWTTFLGDVGAIIIIMLYYLCYTMYLKFVEKRPNFELSLQNFFNETGLGFIVGTVLVFLTTLFIFFRGTFQIISTNPDEFLIHAFLIFALLAFTEDLIFRVIIFRLLEELIGSWLSILFIAAIFGIVHLVHEPATIISTIAIALQDIVLSAAFILTRRIWLCWGIHWGWNYTQDGILGMPNSGVELLPSWLNTEVSGPIWLTGGNIGIEQSVLGVLLNIIAGFIIIKISINRGQLLKPSWRHK